MREPPLGLGDDVLLAALVDQYGLAATDLLFLPLGHDASAWVYRAQIADGSTYFVKLRIAVTNPAALLVPRYLHDHGVEQVVAPVPTRTGSLWVAAGAYALIVYPFVAGVTGMDQGLTADQWRAYGAILRQIHATPVSATLARELRHDTFISSDHATIQQLEDFLATGQSADAQSQALAVCWQTQRAAISTLRQRAEALGQQLARARPPALLCHADIHTNNVLVDQAGRLWIIDWDETMLAPRERDLMFVAGGISERLVGAREEALFFAGYGQIDLDPVALAYYRAAWAIGDIAAFGAQACLRPDLGPISRQAAVDAFAGLFEPGEIVSIAFGSLSD